MLDPRVGLTCRRRPPESLEQLVVLADSDPPHWQAPGGPARAGALQSRCPGTSRRVRVCHHDRCKGSSAASSSSLLSCKRDFKLFARPGRRPVCTSIVTTARRRREIRVEQYIPQRRYYSSSAMPVAAAARNPPSRRVLRLSARRIPSPGPTGNGMGLYYAFWRGESLRLAYAFTARALDKNLDYAFVSLKYMSVPLLTLCQCPPGCR